MSTNILCVPKQQGNNDGNIITLEPKMV